MSFFDKLFRRQPATPTAPTVVGFEFPEGYTLSALRLTFGFEPGTRYNGIVTGNVIALVVRMSDGSSQPLYVQLQKAPTPSIADFYVDKGVPKEVRPGELLVNSDGVVVGRVSIDDKTVSVDLTDRTR